ncbi:DNA-directed RNA polymerase subunit beta [Candidatus Vidania fulgoroideorum]
MIKIFSKNLLIKKHVKIFPKLLKYQKKFFSNYYIKKKITNVLKKHFPIYSKDSNIKIKFSKIIIKKPIIDFNNCLKKKDTYNFNIYVQLNIDIIKKNFLKKIKKNYLLCELPYMLKNSSFLINGIERTVVAQLIKSPGIYFEKKKNQLCFKIIPLKGFWIEIIFVKKKKICFKLNNNKKINIIILLKSFGMSIDDIFNSFSLTRYIKIYKNKVYISKLNSFVFLHKKYHKDIIVCEDFNEKNIFLKANNRINFQEVFKKIEKPIYIKIFDFFENFSNRFLLNSYFLKKIINYKESLSILYHYLNKTKKYNLKKKFLLKYYEDNFRNEKNFFLSKIVRKKLNNVINTSSKSQFIEKEDIINIIKYLLNKKKKKISDPDSLENKIVRFSGDFIKDIIIKKISFLTSNISDRISLKKKPLDFYNIFNNKIISIFIKEFFCVSQFSQFLDQNNNLSEITHKRRVTTLGPGGFKKGRISNLMRDVHLSNYGKICPIETPEGKNIGLVNSFAVFCKINKNLYIESPYIKIKNGILINKYYYLDSFSELNYNISCNFNKKLIKKKIVLYRKKKNISYSFSSKSSLCEITSIQILSLASLFIPFLEHNDANRALMGSNMQRQSVVGLIPNLPFISTGLEILPPLDLGYLVYLRNEKIIYSDSKFSILMYKKNNIFLYKIYDFVKFSFSNQKNLINNNIKDFKILKKKKFFLLNNNSNTVNGKISLGQNLLTAFMPYDGYNFEDSIIISEKISKSDMYSTLIYNEILVDFKKTKFGKEKIDKNFFYINKKNYIKLDKNGIGKVGNYFNSEEIILAKITPVKTQYISPEEKLIKKIIRGKKLDFKNSYVKIPKELNGILSKIEIIEKKKIKILDGFDNNNDKLIYKKIIKNLKKNIKKKKYNNFKKIIVKNRIKYIKKKIKKTIKPKGFSLGVKIYKQIKLIFISKRNLEIGDKMSGRHGNKGVISKILPVQDMPFLADGTVIDLILNPLGIPSRMNLGQLYEVNFGFIIFGIKKRVSWLKKNKLKLINFLNKIKIKKINYKNLFNNYYFFSIPFEGADIKDLIRLQKFVFNKKISKKYFLNKKKDKLKLINGKTGFFFGDYVNVGYIYFMKLHHIAYEKIHARSVGPYSSITQQPLKGRSRLGGQRFGEMEVWALEAYGAAYILQELLTIKSDDIKGRSSVYKKICKGKIQITPNIPESFNILIKEINSLCLNINLK